jgi:hypothetical protein
VPIAPQPPLSTNATLHNANRSTAPIAPPTRVAPLKPTAPTDTNRQRTRAAREGYVRWKYSAYSTSTAGFDVCTFTSGGTSSNASE